VLGAIYLDSRRDTCLFTDAERDTLSTVTNFLAPVIEKSRAFQKTRDENILLRTKTFNEFAKDYLIGESVAIANVRSMIEQVAVTDSTILITGETGCGKGIVARIIHQRSSRKNGKFVLVNCGGLPETLFESELFGYRKGAFTGAHIDKVGLFEEANKGTLFLDEISNAPLATQGKLLESIEEKRIRRLGETVVRKVDVRLLSATNQDLRRMVQKGLFRSDLFYRVSVVRINMPSLRERIVDIPLLANHFLEKYAREINKRVDGFARKTLKLMLSYKWPGNVRELQNAVERAVIFTKGKCILPDDLRLDEDILEHVAAADDNKQRIINALKIARGNISMAARILGVTRATVYNRIRKYRIDILKEFQ